MGSDGSEDAGARRRLAAELRELQAAVGLSLKELERATHTSDSSLSRYFSGRSVPPWSVVEALSRLAGRAPETLRAAWVAARRTRIARSGGKSGDALHQAGPYDICDTLPRSPSAFVGRKEEVAALLAEPGLWVVDGMAGVGKSALAVQVARTLARRGGDVLYLHLHGHTAGRGPLAPQAALAGLLHAVGVADTQDDLDVRAALWRSHAARRDLVLVLDDASDAAQIRPLLPGSPTAAVLVTSRRRLPALEGARPLSLTVPSLPECRELFDAVAGPERRAAEPAEVDAIIGLCGRLPLAVQLCAARLLGRPAWSAAALARRLRDENRRLRELAADASGVAAALTLSVAQLDEPLRPAFALLGSLTGPRFDAYTAAALWGVPVLEAEDMVQDLVDAHLVEEPAADTYRLHDLVHAFARSLDVPARDRAQARLIDYLLAASARAVEVFDPFNTSRAKLVVPDVPDDRLPSMSDSRAAGTWFEQHAGSLVHWAQSLLDERSVALLRNAYRFLWLRGRGGELVAMGRAAGEGARRTGSQADQAWALTIVGFGYTASQRPDEAMACFESALEQAADPDRGYLLNALAVANTALWRLSEAERWCREAVRYFQSIGYDRGTGLALSNLAEIVIRQGFGEQGLRYCEQALSWFRPEGYDSGISTALLMKGDALWRMERLDEAEDHYREALELAERQSYFENIADALRGLAVVHRDRGELVRALEFHDRVDAVLAEAGSTHSDHAEFLVERAGTELAAGRAEAAERSARRALQLATAAHNPFEEGRAMLLLAELTELTDYADHTAMEGEAKLASADADGSRLL